VSGALFQRALDVLEHRLILVRMRMFDWLHGPEPETPADRQRERERHRLRRAFPKIDFDGQGPRRK
jgi:hypothetical protein